ncbi:MAG: sigma 54-interacting transcriptional regulator, partial [Rubrivivax sp.]
DGQFYRVGGHQSLRVSVRVIAATHQNLEERVRQGAFREDLFHRLNVIRLRLPPLRERREDIPALARSFLARSAKELGVETKRLTEAALARLSGFDFPGNVRQLENVCHWLTVMAPGQVVEEKDLPPEVQAAPPAAAPAAVPSEAAGAQGPSGLPGSSGSLGSLGSSGAPGGMAAGHSTPAASAGAPARQALPAGGEWVPAAPEPLAIGPGGLTGRWLDDLQRQAREMLEQGRPDVWEALSREFESTLIEAALAVTRGRRIEAAHKLGIGRNTITRKIQELRLDGG